MRIGQVVIGILIMCYTHETDDIFYASNVLLLASTAKYRCWKLETLVSFVEERLKEQIWSGLCSRNCLCRGPQGPALAPPVHQFGRRN